MEKKDLDWANLSFEYQPTDYSYVSNYRDGAWDDGALTADHSIRLSECAGILHYCQEVFEGLKAYTTESGDVVCFRPDQNAHRMADSARRIVMPPFPEDRFVDAVEKVVRAMKEAGIGYGAINHPLDRDPVCGYTGVIVDASGMGLKPSFSPVIYDTSGRAIYGVSNINYDRAIERGMVGYAGSLYDAQTLPRIGGSPLVVKAVQVRGGNNSTNPVNVVVSVEDGDRILAANQQSQMLTNGAVVFVR